MADKHILNYSGEEIDNLLLKINSIPERYELPATGASQIIPTLFGDYKITTQSLGSKTTYKSSPISELSRRNAIESSGYASWSNNYNNKSFYLTANGIKKEIAFLNTNYDFSTNKSSYEVQQAFQTKINEAFGEGKIEVYVRIDARRGFSLGIKSMILPQIQLLAESNPNTDKDMLTLLKIESGATNVLNTIQTIGEFVGASITNFTYTINNTTKNCSTDISLNDFFNEVSKCGENVNMYYNFLDDACYVQHNYCGANEFTISDTLGLFDALGLEEGVMKYTIGSNTIVHLINPEHETTHIQLNNNEFNLSSNNNNLALLDVLYSSTDQKIQTQIFDVLKQSY